MEITRTHLPHPSRGGARGYDVAFRESEVASFDQGYPTTASESSIYRWKRRLHPFIMNGNKEREVLVGIDQFHLCIFYWPTLKQDWMKSSFSLQMQEMGLSTQDPK